MCSVCGCEEGETRIEGQSREHRHHQGHAHTQEDGGEHRHTHQGMDEGLHHYGHGAARAHAPGMSQARMLQVEQDILAKNDTYAAANRSRFAARGILALNLVSSPGSGKTSLLVRTIEALAGEIPMAVIEGDQQTTLDADRIRRTGVPALQVNTGKGCHLDGHMVGHAMESLDPPADGLLFIENVGNLVCPAAFDLGEGQRVTILSVTEGEDKPIKYPDMIHSTDLVLLNKVDLLPYVQFDVAQCLDYARRVNPRIKVLQVSATTGQGMEAWYAWLRAQQQIALLGKPPATVEAARAVAT